MATPRKNSEAEPLKPPKSKADGTWGVHPKSVSRIETEKHCAWYVRIYFEGAYVRKTFSDTKYNGKDDALREAIAWRNQMEARMGKPRTDRSVRKKTSVDERVAGIRRRTMKDKKRGKSYLRDVFEVTFSPTPGKVWRTKISVTKHGEEEAFRMALEIRRQKEREFYGGEIS